MPIKRIQMKTKINGTLEKKDYGNPSPKMWQHGQTLFKSPAWFALVYNGAKKK